MSAPAKSEIIDWLLKGDISIRYQTQRDLLNRNNNSLRKSIAGTGWARRILKLQKPDGHWGKSFYNPKWICTHYTLLDLRLMEVEPVHAVRNIINRVCDSEKGPDGGILPIGTTRSSDVCVNGMFLNYAAFFETPENQLKSIVDFILNEHMPDGGFNCMSNRKGAVHSSMHSTLSVLEGMHVFRKQGYRYRLKALSDAEKQAREFLLMHWLFKSDRTGEIINKNFLKFAFPPRWYYDILRALDYFQAARVRYDARMCAALEELMNRRGPDGKWSQVAHHPGQRHFDMEQAGKAGRWNTLRALRVLKFYGKHLKSVS